MSITWLGDYDTTETVNIPLNTFDSNDPTASVTATNLAAGDVEIHKDGSTTQRSSDAGVTVTIDFDSVTGNHLIAIDLSDNTDAGFYAAGSRYLVRVEGVTVDAGTINAWVAAFSIGCMLRPTTNGRTLDVTATGAAGIDWANVEGQATAVDLSATAIDLCDEVTLTDTNSDMRGTDSAGTAAELAKVPKSDAAVSWNATALAAIQSEANDALVAQKLDHLVAVADADDVVDDSIIAKLASLGATADWSTFVNTTDSLQAIRDRGDAEWITATSVTVSDKTGFSLSSAGIDAIWDQASDLTISFETMMGRIYQLLNNEYNITNATGVSALRNIADSADTATGSVTDDGTTTSRARFTWA